MTSSKRRTELLRALERAIDEYAPVFQKLRDARDLAGYLAVRGDRADEEILTEPILRSVIERVLGFPKGRYLEQLGKSGRKPDFTPEDLIAHAFVLDAKSSDENLAYHEPQIRGYMQQRRLDAGILFNLREVRVYERSAHGHTAALSFPLLPVWQVARGEAIAGDEVERFLAFCERFAYREVDRAAKVEYISEQPPWPSRFQSGESFEIDVEALVERLRRLSRRLGDDANAQVEFLEAYVSLDADRERKLLEELELLALDIAPGTDPGRLPGSLREWRTDGSPAIAAVWRQYLVRVAYLALTRIVLYRAWEDVEFVDSYLHDGGFEHWYAERGGSARRVLDEAFLHGGERYPWLFGRENNYDWYHPREEALVDVLYALAPEPLGQLDADVLGSLYATYVEEIDRDRLGQFFTPRDVVRFMLDRAGFVGHDAVFRVEGDERKPVEILDFATGSGGFLVEAARRIIDAIDPGKAEPRALYEALRAIVGGMTGGEISPFPYYLTEINLLLQVSRLLGPLHTVEDGPVASFGALGVLPVDTLAAKSARERSLELEPEQRADHAELVADERLGLVPLDGAKREIYRSRLKPDEQFDLVVGNPPYVSEAGNKALFDRLRAIPAWRGIYRGKTDYLYYFLLLAVEKLKPGGKLAVITPAGWMNAGSAGFLRERLASGLTLEQLYLFGSYRLFATDDAAPTPTVESAILIATKAPAPKGHKLRVVALEDEEAAPADRHALLEEMQARAAARGGRRGGIHVHSLPQDSLVADRPWPVKFGAKDVATLAVAHLQTQLDEGKCEPLERSWNVFQGIQTAADAYTKRIDKRLTVADRAKLAGSGARIGDAILELPPGAESRRPWSEHPELLAHSPEPTAVLYGAIDEADYTSLVVIRRDPPSDVLEELERFKPLLTTRAEIARNMRRHWWETAWPRDAREMSTPKVIALYRTDRGRFALDEAGDWQPSIKSTLAIGRGKDAPVAYLCGLLNSELLDLWYAVRGKTPWHVRRNYEPKRMNEMPYRPPDGDPRADEIADLVRSIAGNRRALLPYRSVVRDLDRIVKDPWKTGPVDIDERALVAELPVAEKVSLRLDPDLSVELPDAGSARITRANRGTLELRRGRLAAGTVRGDEKRLDLLEAILAGKAGAEIEETLLPKDLERFRTFVDERHQAVSALLADGRELVERVERLVCALYDVPDDLTEQVVAHAVRRSMSKTH
ncbi:MAG: HsdM family class I SAM-dependent methyltransferase [Gaiellaceae bacterium]